ACNPANLGTDTDHDCTHTTLAVSGVNVPGPGGIFTNTMFVAVAADAGSYTVTVSDSAGNFYSSTADADITSTGSGSNVRTLLFSAPITNALSSGSVTVTFGGTAPCDKVASFFYAADLMSPSKDLSHTGQGKSTSPNSGPTALTSQPDELLIGVI